METRQHESIDAEIEKIIEHPREKAFRDLRDRACYMFLTGSHPSHLRPLATRMLSRISRMANRPASLNGRHGDLKLDEGIARKLDLDRHPMVAKVRQLSSQGFSITVSRGANSRKPYTKIFMSRGDNEITVQIDGSVLDHWP